MFEFKFALLHFSRSPASLIISSLIIILFIIIIVIGNSLFTSANEELSRQINDFFPGQLLIERKAQPDEVIHPGLGPRSSLPVIPQFTAIMKYIDTLPRVKQALPYNFAALELMTGGVSLLRLDVLCVPASSTDFLLTSLSCGQGFFPSPSHRGLAMSQELQQRLGSRFGTDYNPGDLIALKSPGALPGFSLYSLPLTGIFSRKTAGRAYDFSASLLILDEISFKIIFSLPLMRADDPAINDNKSAGYLPLVFAKQGPLFVLPDMDNGPHSEQNIFSLLGDVRQKYAASGSRTQIWQGILLELWPGSGTEAARMIADFTAYCRLNDIPAQMEEWPGRNFPLRNGIESATVIFNLLLLIAALLIILGSNVLNKPNPDQHILLSLHKENKPGFSLAGLYFSRAVMQSLACGLLGFLFSYLIVKFLLRGEVIAQPGLFFYNLFKTDYLYLELKAPAFLLASGFLFIYAACSWIYPVCLIRRKSWK